MRKRADKMPKFSGSIAFANRWTGEPHDHSRERARNGWYRCRKGTGPFTLGGKMPPKRTKAD